MPRKIIHLIPYDGIGGVELAAASAEGATLGDLRLERMFVFENVQDRKARMATFNPLTLWRAAGRLAAARADLVILSLWRSVIVGILSRLRGCRAPMVLFLHNSLDAHLFDRLATRIAVGFARAVWADSRETLDRRLDIPGDKPTRVISYFVERREPVRPAAPPPGPDFVFWGRLAEQKDPLRSLRLFRRIRQLLPDATLTLIGPDGGLAGEVDRAIRALGIAGAARVLGPRDRKGIEQAAAGASFYLQTSRYEGMALSVIEAMQAGLVPVVTPVGEIARYTRDGETAVWITDGDGEERAIATVQNLIANPGEWRAMRQRAMAEFADRALYRDDIMQAARDLLGRPGLPQA